MCFIGFQGVDQESQRNNLSCLPVSCIDILQKKLEYIFGKSTGTWAELKGKVNIGQGKDAGLILW